MARTPRPVERTWQPDAALLDGLTIAAVALDADGVVRYANAAALDLFASTHDSLVGSQARSSLFDDPERGVVDEVMALVRGSGRWTGDVVMRCGGHRTATLATSWTATAQGGVDSGVLLLAEGPRGLFAEGEPDDEEEVAAPLPLGRRLRRLASVTDELLAAETVERVADIVTDHMMNAAGATVASMSMMVDHETLALLSIRGGLEGVASRWATYPLDSNTPAAESARTGRALYLDRDEFARRYPELESAGPGHRSILCLPLRVSAGRVIGVVSLSFPGRRQIDEAEHLFLRLLADTCAMTLDRIEAQRAAVDREDKLSFLAEASARLASDLDYEATLVLVAELAVPWFADWCAIALEEDGELRTLSVAHAHPELSDLVQELQERYPPDPSGDRGGYGVLRSGESQLFPEITDEVLEESAQDEEHLRLMRMLNLRSGMSCPLKVADRVLGVITWIAGEEGRRFSEDDLAFGEDLARRGAIAIDNAQLHSQVRTAALQLQRAVLPERLPEIDGWSTAVQYLPAGRTDAGGDFYDVLLLEDGRVAMFVGDVMGRGVMAASVMAQMRSAIRTLVAVDPTPTAVLAGMDRVFEALHLEQLVTMVYAVADPALGRLEVINAGHPPPVLLAADGQMVLLEHPSTLILGAGGGERAVRSVGFGPGDRLLLYTDGLVERRGEDADTAMARLVEALRTHRPGLDDDGWLSSVVEEVRDPTRDDDVAAVLISRDADRR